MFSRIAEKIIQKAMDEGVFDDLSGKGKPLSFEEESGTPPEWRMAFRILKNANLSPRWIELDKEISSELTEAREEFQRALNIFGSQGERWDRAVRNFTLRINQLNEFLRELNLIVPKAQFQRSTLHPEEEIKRVMSRSIGIVDIGEIVCC
jgi:hypothetical protein